MENVNIKTLKVNILRFPQVSWRPTRAVECQPVLRVFFFKVSCFNFFFPLSSGFEACVRVNLQGSANARVEVLIACQRRNSLVYLHIM